MDSTKSDKTSSDDDAKIKTDLFNLVEKLRIELQQKDQQLQAKDQELQEIGHELEGKNEEIEGLWSQTDQLGDGLANAQQIIRVLQLSLWKSFPSPGISYYIKTQSESQNGQFSSYLYGFSCLRSSAIVQSRCEFKFNKNSDGSFSISTMVSSQEKYLQTNTRSSRVGFTANSGSGEKFVLFHQQNKHAGILVDISTLAGSFLCMDMEMDDNNFVVANSQTPPANKFLIVPVGVQ